MRRRASLLVVLIGALAQPIHARAEALVDKVEALLAAGIEPSEQRATIVAFGEPGEQALVQVFERASAPRYVRLRALSVLQSFRSESAARYFESLVRAAQLPEAVVAKDEALGELHPARSPMVLRRALEGLLETASARKEPLASEPVGACLAHPDAHVRKLAARVLATLDDGDRPGVVEQQLSTRLARERSPMVRGSLQQALTSRSARRAAPR